MDSIKLYRPKDRPQDSHLFPLPIAELSDSVSIIRGIEWTLDPAGDIPIKNSDGSIITLEAMSGFLINESGLFCIYYEHDHGIVVHIKHDATARSICEHLAIMLDASIDEFGRGYEPK